MVFQSYALFPHLSVAENILFGLKVRKVPADERSRRLAKTAELLGLDALLSRKPSQLSGGQQQRVALGRAIISEAKVCLMDEPLSNLDAQLRVEMRREIRELQQRLGITMIYVTHDQLEAMTMADSVVLMRDGQIEQHASPADLYHAPASMFAARFIGTPPMNVVPWVQLSKSAMSLQTLAPRMLAPEELAVGVRPEKISLAAAGVPGRVIAAEYLGADTVLQTRVGDALLSVRVPGQAALTKGDGVNLRWDNSALHWFDLSSGRRLA